MHIENQLLVVLGLVYVAYLIARWVNSIEVRPKFAKWQAVQQEKARKADIAQKKRYMRIAAEERAIYEEIAARRARGEIRKWDATDYGVLVFGLVYVAYVLNWASLLFLGQPLW